MNSKKITLTLIIIILSLLLIGCGTTTPNKPPEEKPPEDNKGQETEQDANTTASIVNEESAFKKAISKEGTWIIITLKDLTFDDDLEVEGEFRDKDEKDNELYRKLALYDQDKDRNITKRYTITTPKMIIKSPSTEIKGGVIKGDVYVEAEDFSLSDATIEGNLFFSKEEYKSTFELEDGSKVTGDTEVKE